jgi:hypothetical protein
MGALSTQKLPEAFAGSTATTKELKRASVTRRKAPNLFIHATSSLIV